MKPNAALPVPSFDELMDSAQHSAVHLEMRDAYAVHDETGEFANWQLTGERPEDPEYWADWVDLIGRARARGVTVRRARIVSEPVTEYIRFEYAGTYNVITAGEEVRWLPRRQASDIALPGNDFWLFDGRLALFNHFTGAGDWSEPRELRTEPAVAALCATAFEAVWERGIPHEKFTV